MLVRVRILEKDDCVLTSKAMKRPRMPPTQEWEEPMATHLPYRSWCDICVAGRRDNPPHLARTPEERSVPEIGMDYCFVERKVEEESTTVIVVKDRDSKAIRAHALQWFSLLSPLSMTHYIAPSRRWVSTMQKLTGN